MTCYDNTIFIYYFISQSSTVQIIFLILTIYFKHNHK